MSVEQLKAGEVCLWCGCVRCLIVVIVTRLWVALIEKR